LFQFVCVLSIFSVFSVNHGKNKSRLV
jgi:hypothetical protein